MTEAVSPPLAPARPVRWGIPDAALAWVGAQVLALVWLIGVLAITGHTDGDLDELPLGVVALTQLGLALGFLLGPWWVTRTKGHGLVEDLGLRARWPDLWQGGLAGIATQIVLVPLLYWPLLELLDKATEDLEGPAKSLTDRADGPIDVLFLVVIVGVLAPVFEEIFFRGLVQRSLLKRGLGPVLAIGITALFFGVTHALLLQLPGLVLAGAIFGALAHRAGRLGPAIAAHVTFNMVTVIVLLAT